MPHTAGAPFSPSFPVVDYFHLQPASKLAGFLFNVVKSFILDRIKAVSVQPLEQIYLNMEKSS
jgi:hypothetical protein